MGTIQQQPTISQYELPRRDSTGPLTGRNSGVTTSARYSTGSLTASPGFDRAQRQNPPMCAEVARDIIDMFHVREEAMSRDAKYLETIQGELTEKMRTILVDWLVDVHLKFKLHEETFFLAVDIVDRYLSVAKVTRAQLQLVGITAILLAAKYEEIWPPEVKECLQISANTYTRDELLKMERDICAALKFRLTVPTSFPFLARLLETTEADEVTRNAAFFFMEHAVQDYRHLAYRPSQIANASMYLANLLLRKPDPWNFTLQYYSKARLESFSGFAAGLLEYVHANNASKYQAIKRKYTSSKYSEVARMALPTEVNRLDL